MKESYYSFKGKVKESYDIVFVARNSINGASMNEVQHSLYGTLKSCGLFK